MIHIKLFEGFSTEDYYQPLETEDYHNKVGMSVENNCFFEKKDIRYLISLFDSTYPFYMGVQVYDQQSWHKVLVSKEDINNKMLDKVYNIRSYKTSSSIGFSISPVGDDYFVVSIDVWEWDLEYYLCDQMGGVIKLLKDIGIL